MEIFLSILFWAGVSLGSCLLLFLIFPLHIEGGGVLSEHTIEARFHFRWAFGFLAVKGDTQQGAFLYFLGLRTFRIKKSASDEKKEKEEKKEKPPRKKRSAPFSAWVRWFREHSQTISPTLKQLFAAFHIEGRLHGTVGIGDPAKMAMLDLLRRYFQPIGGPFQIDIWPNYIDEDIDLTLRISAWFVCLQLLFLPISWLLRSDTRRMIFHMPRAKKVNKEA